MNDKKWWKHIRMFFQDHLWVILLFMAAPAALTGFYVAVVEDVPGTSWLYYWFLSLFVLFCFLLYRLYTTWNLYELYCAQKKEMEDFLLYDAKGREEQHCQKLLGECYRLYLGKVSRAEDDRKQNKLMIYRWVHQLKTPLSVIQLIAQNHEMEEGYKKILQSAAQIQYDLDQILNLYKLDAMQNDFHAEPVSLRQLARDSINSLKASFIERGIFPKLEAEKEWIVYTDSKWLRFVLYQLLTNALKYSDRGKTVTIRISGEKKETILSVEDEGCGIRPEDIPRIFDLFFTGQNGRLRGESTGLGLYMVRQILDYLGHSVRVQSVPGEGSRFQIVFGERRNGAL